MIALLIICSEALGLSLLVTLICLWAELPNINSVNEPTESVIINNAVILTSDVR